VLSLTVTGIARQVFLDVENAQVRVSEDDPLLI
jgi:hypothetical protein